MFKKDIFGHIIFIKAWLIRIIGLITFPGLNWFNTVKISGTEHLANLPNTRVLFVSNHQTYFADVITFIHIFCSHRFGFKNKISNPLYLLRPKTDTYFIAAEETMKAGLLPKIFAYVGSVSIKRTWRAEGKDVNRQVDMSDISNIGKAIENGWVITFPQGTTKPFVPGRRGTAHLIKTYQTIVVPITISGFRFAFDKKGLKLKKRGVKLQVNIKEPLKIDYSVSSDEILEQIMDAIEQSEKFRPTHLSKAAKTASFN